ncbi:glycosyltransferase family 1 protein [Candidatus Thorarchaeota archaeon]|nr:MAG: glycosyltransferase family 1 protein [Candidatus Thorarchaeota archaeon]
MKIGMVSKFDAADGLCVRANEVLQGLADRGHEIHVFTQSQEVAGIPKENIHRFRALQLNPHFSLDSFNAIKLIAEVCQRHDIEVLHVQMNSGSTEFLIPYFDDALPPRVVTFHLAYASGSSTYTTLFEIAWKASIFAARKYDQIILVDPSQKPYFTRLGVPDEQLSVITNGVNINLFKPGKLKENNKLDFVYVGRLSYDKGVHILLKAFQKYHQENPDSRLTLIGDGMVKHQIRKYNENESIRWLGVVNHHHLPQILSAMDVFVIPQNIGGLGLSVMEAMSCGLPVITTAIGETAKLLGPEEGILVEPHSMHGVLDAMRRIGMDSALRADMAKRCRRKIEHLYSWKQQLGILEETYQKAIRSKN